MKHFFIVLLVAICATCTAQRVNPKTQIAKNTLSVPSFLGAGANGEYNHTEYHQGVKYGAGGPIVAPSTNAPKMYLDTTAGILYVWNGSEWVPSKKNDFENGLYADLGKVKLGGALTESTTINGVRTKSLKFLDMSSIEANVVTNTREAKWKLWGNGLVDIESYALDNSQASGMYLTPDGGDLVAFDPTGFSEISIKPNLSTIYSRPSSTSTIGSEIVLKPIGSIDLIAKSGLLSRSIEVSSNQTKITNLTEKSTADRAVVIDTDGTLNYKKVGDFLSSQGLSTAADHSTSGVAIGKPFLASNSNLMGVTPGTLVFRQY
jgi:hypothetical protein